MRCSNQWTRRLLCASILCVFAVIAHAGDAEDVFWDSVVKGNAREEYELYLKQYPRGRYASGAKRMLEQMGGKAQMSSEATRQKDDAKSVKPPVFIPLEPFTVNLQFEDTAQYLQVGLTLKISDSSYIDVIKLKMPDIRNRILLLLSGKKASQIATLEGKQTLAAEIAREIARSVESRASDGSIFSVLYTSFVIQ